MKTLHTILVAAALALPMVARAGVVGTPHDFSAESWNVSPSDPNTVCGTCHSPHHADSSVVPLWIHGTTSAGGWVMYNSANVPVSDLQSDAKIVSQPAGISKACLSCHDGTVAINTYGGTSGNIYITNSARIAEGPAGRDMTHTHPISLTFDSSIAGVGAGKDKFLFNPDTRNALIPDSGTFISGNDMTVNGFLLGGKHRLECNSCHDVHNQEGTPYSLAFNPKLVKIVGTQGGRGSLLCRSCHDK